MITFNVMVSNESTTNQCWTSNNENALRENDSYKAKIELSNFNDIFDFLSNSDVVKFSW